MVTAKDIMTAQPWALEESQEVETAVDFFLANHVSSAPVVDSSQQIVGQLLELDLVRAFVQTRVRNTQKRYLRDFRDLMVDPQFVNESDPIAVVVKALRHSSFHRVLVENADKKLTGIISPKDVLQVLKGDKEQKSHMVGKLQQLEGEVEQLKHQLESTEEALESYDKLLKSSGYMMHSVDENGTILFANPALHKTLGYTDKELVGQSVYNIYPKHLHTQISASLEKIKEKGGQDANYSSYVRSSGEEVRVEVLSSSLTDKKGGFVGTFTIARPLNSEEMLRVLHGILN